jgi:hypothetical protein
MNDPSDPGNRFSLPARDQTVRIEPEEMDDYLARIRRRLSTRPLGKHPIEDIPADETQETHTFLKARLSAPIVAALWAPSGPYARQWIILTADCSELSVGRSRESTVEMSRDPLLSRTHFNLRVVPPLEAGANAYKIQIEDLSSTNGTFINGQKLAPHQPALLQSGDAITAGSSEFLVALYMMRARD